MWILSKEVAIFTAYGVSFNRLSVVDFGAEPWHFFAAPNAAVRKTQRFVTTGRPVFARRRRCARRVIPKSEGGMASLRGNARGCPKAVQPRASGCGQESWTPR
jgi:hypothetical protein